MNQPLSSKQLNSFRDQLNARLQELLNEIRQELHNADEQQFNELAGRVHDLEEESVANLLVDLNLTNIDRHVQEVRDIEGALIRIDTGEYGVCIDCAGPINPERLDAYPTAKRCIICQQRYEQTHAGNSNPRL